MSRIARPLVVLVAAFACAWAAPRVVGPAVHRTSVADVELRLRVSSPADRGVSLYVPLADWGLRARVMDAPVQVGAEPRRINRTGVVRVVSTGGRGAIASLRSELDAALRSATRRFVLVSLAGALVGGLLAMLVWHVHGVRGPRLLIAPAAAVGATVLVGGVLAAWAAISFDARKLERPEYYASGVELERLLEQAEALRRSGQKYADRVDNAVLAITGLLSGGGGGSDPLGAGDANGETQRVILASDVHNNLLTLPTLRRFAAGHLTVLAGDFTINGGRMEAPLAAQMATVGDPVVAVSGNHDSLGIMATLRRRGVVVLTHDAGVRRIEGIAIAGFEDPLMLGGREFPVGIRAGLSFGDIPRGRERFLEAVEQRWTWWQELPERPDVLVVHQAAIGRALAERIWAADPDGAPLTILAGHTHRQRMDRYGPVTVIDAGSIGAGGLFGIGSQEVGLAMLDLRRDGSLEATELVSQDPATSAARARRVITASPDCDGTLVVCHEEPEAPEPTATP